MELSKRLQAVVNLVTKGNSVADIGCDHGYVAIYLYTQNISNKIIALDVNKGPLQKAKDHMVKYDCSEIEIRLSNGLEALEIGEVESIICAGMGGKLILRMIESQFLKALQMKECILQPQSEVGLVRRQLVEWGFELLQESMVYEEGKYYPIMKVANTKVEKKVSYCEWEYQFGPILLSQRDLILHEYLKKRKLHYEKLLNELGKCQKVNCENERMKELTYDLHLVERALQQYHSIE